MDKMKCEVDECSTEGGKFVLQGGKWKCEYHASGAYRDSAKGFQEFTTTHMDGKGTPIHVTSLRQLRKLENTYGVANCAYNSDAKNFDRR